MDFRSLFIDKDKIVMANMELGVALNSLDEAIVLNQLNYWIERNKDANRNFRDGHYWVYNSYEAWRKQDFPVWSATKIKRIFTSLEGKGIVLSANYNKLAIDKTKWYTIDYDKLKKFIEEYSKGQNEKSKDQDEISKDADDQSTDQNDQTLDQSERTLPDTNYRYYSTENTNRDYSTENTDKYALKDVKKSSFKGNMYASVPEEQEGGAPKKQSRYIPKNYTEEQLREHIKPVVENEVKQYIDDFDTNFPDDTEEIFADILCAFCKRYKGRFGESHYVMPDKTLKSAVRRYLEPPEEMDGIFDFESYKELIDKYFSTDFNRIGKFRDENGKKKKVVLSFSHFMSDAIRGNLANRLWL